MEQIAERLLQVVCLAVECTDRSIQLDQRTRRSGQGKVFTRRRIGGIYDHIYLSLVKKASSIKDDEWERGMYYPIRWDPNFDEFMTLESLFYYPIRHFNFHQTQLARK